MKTRNHTKIFFYGIKEIADKIDISLIEMLVNELLKIKKRGGRIFFLGVGGSAGNASHAVNDFRKLCEIESYSPLDNVSEFSARVNDEGWDLSLSEWLKVSKLNHKDAVFILSVGGGNFKKKVSTNIIYGIKLAKKRKSKILGIVGRDGGYTNLKGDIVVKVPNVNSKLVTPFVEAYQAVIWHCLVSHPKLQSKKTKW